MATVYPTAAGAWSTRTWNDDATGAAYGPGTPQAGDTVLANGLAITIDVDITVAALSTRVGTTAVAGGSFTTTGPARIVNADSYAGTTNCLIMPQFSNSVQNGDSYGSDTTNTRYGTTINSGCIQNGNSYGQNGSTRSGTNVLAGGIQNGNSFGGSASFSFGSVVATGGIQYGDATGGTNSNSFGTAVTAGGWLIGNAYAGSSGHGANIVGIMIGNAVGGAVPGVTLGAGGLFYGDAIGGNTSGAHGLLILSSSSAFVNTATGDTENAFGVFGNANYYGPYTVVIANESGAYPKSLTSYANTTYELAPFADPSSMGGGGGPTVTIYTA